jgi:hypothetical protein
MRQPVTTIEAVKSAFRIPGLMVRSALFARVSNHGKFASILRDALLGGALLRMRKAATFP